MAATFGIALVEMTGGTRTSRISPLRFLRLARGFVGFETKRSSSTALQAADAFRPPGRFDVGQALLFSAELLL